MSAPGARFGAHPGLCGLCAHAIVTVTRRGPTYLRCGLAATDSRLHKYPVLPVLACVGFEPEPR